MTTLGNIALLDQQPVGFLCSRTTASSAILPCLDWATEMAKGNVPVMSTFHSEIESAVLDILLHGKCPIIMLLGRSLYKVMPERLKQAYEDGRLLIISVSTQPRISRESAFNSNKYIAEIAKSLTFGFLAEESSLYPIYEDARDKGKQCYVLSKPSRTV